MDKRIKHTINCFSLTLIVLSLLGCEQASNIENDDQNQPIPIANEQNIDFNQSLQIKTAEEAKALAQGYIANKFKDLDEGNIKGAAIGVAPEEYDSYLEEEYAPWKGAWISEVTPFYSSDGILLAFDTKISNPDNPDAGYMMIGAHETYSVVMVSGTDGKSNKEILVKVYEEEYNEPMLQEGNQVKFLWFGPMDWAAEVILPDQTTRHVYPDVSVMPAPYMAADALYKNFDYLGITREEFIKERNDFITELLNYSEQEKN